VVTARAKHARVILPGRMSDSAVSMSKPHAVWLADLIQQSTPKNKPSHPYPLLREARSAFPGNPKEFATYLDSPSWKKVRAAGLLLV